MGERLKTFTVKHNPYNNPSLRKPQTKHNPNSHSKTSCPKQAGSLTDLFLQNNIQAQTQKQHQFQVFMKKVNFVQSTKPAHSPQRIQQKPQRETSKMIRSKEQGRRKLSSNLQDHSGQSRIRRW